jgi:hypothetical protein
MVFKGWELGTPKGVGIGILKLHHKAPPSHKRRTTYLLGEYLFVGSLSNKAAMTRVAQSMLWSQ